MQPDLKYFYLLQFSYWLQQLLVLALRLEKPRVDFKELVIHHIVTLWLIGCVLEVVVYSILILKNSLGGVMGST